MAAGRRMNALRLPAGLVLAALSGPCMAHGFSGAGWVHPLTGLDHMLAMVAVGLWSAQLGGRAIGRVPVAFMLAMTVGSAFGLRRWPIEGVEVMVPASVLIVGAAMAVRARLAWPAAAAAALLFGLAHGYVHGLEAPASEGLAYSAGLLLTTAGLHIAGAAAGQLLLEKPEGQRWLRTSGAFIAAACGVLLRGVL